MAERIVSPGVFTRENDQSFLQAGVASIGATIVGPTVKGPAFAPTVVRSFSEFEAKFGGQSQYTYVPFSVRDYLSKAGSVIVVRVLAGGGYTFDGASRQLVAAVSGSTILTVFQPSLNTDDTTIELGNTLSSSLGTSPISMSNAFGIDFSGSAFQSAYSVTASLNPQRDDYVTRVLGTSPMNSDGTTDKAFCYLNFKDEQNSIVNQTVTSTVSVATAEIDYSGGVPSVFEGIRIDNPSGDLVAILRSGSFSFYNSALNVGFYQSAGLTGLRDIINNNAELSANLSASINGTTFQLTSSLVGAAGNGFNIITGSSGADIGSPSTPVFTTTTGGVSLTSAVPSEVNLVKNIASCAFTSTATEGYDHASTPWITSQILDAGGSTSNLFKFHHLADGTPTNKDVYVSIAGLKEPADINDVEQYSTFDVLIRKYGDTDRKASIVEQYTGVNLDPDSPNYISRVIGDRYNEYDSTLEKVVTKGDYNTTGNYLRVEVNPAVRDKAYSPKLSPKGFLAPTQTITGFTGYDLVAPTYKLQQHLDKSGTNPQNYSSRAYLGWDFLLADNGNYINPVPSSAASAVARNYSNAGNGSAVTLTNFNTDNLFGHPSSSLWVGSLSASLDSTGAAGPAQSQLQFSIPMQGGFDGISPQRIINVGEDLSATNSFGFDISSTSAVGTTAYKKVFNILSNDDQYDFNVLTTPGILQSLSPEIVNSAIDMVAERGDAFYPFDLSPVGASVGSTISQIQNSGIDSNYAATYYPWVRVLDSSINKPVYVPPSVILPGLYAQSDSRAAEWFAPAGLNRGGLGGVLEVKNPLKRTERDSLYEESINPIATFPGQGVCIWGQKTLQQQPSALDRINVRRLLIALKKFIASSSRYLIFENNTTQTRNRFLNIVNPYLESVQQRQGLYAFKVVMDDTNNTPDVIDRNQLVGQIYLQPAKAVEFIVLDFNVLPTGATFG
tara:strand:+ start:2086 stop:4941 length:2856 start_codon:yes stop_codon:yes gene_type:complete